MRVSDVADRFKRHMLLDLGRTPKHVRAIQASMHQLVTFANTENVSSLDKGVVQEFLRSGREQRMWKPQTQKHHRNNIRTFFGWCVTEELLSKNPTDGVKTPPIGQLLPRCVRSDESSRILGCASSYPWHYEIEHTRNMAIIGVFMFAGLRLRELRLLATSDVDLESKQIFVANGKQSKQRIVPIHPRLLPMLKNYIAGAQRLGFFPARYFFRGIHSDKPLQPRDVKRITDAIAKAAGVYFTPHMLRHTFATAAINKECNPLVLQRLMGHSDIRQTMRYVDVAQDAIRDQFTNLALY